MTRSRARVVCAAVLAVVMVTSCGGAPERSDVMRDGRSLFTGKGCSSCHGGVGQGGVGPAMSGLPETFSSCADQIEWVTLGSARWLRERGATYGDPGKPVRGGMPSFGERLSDEELRTVITYERVAFGGLDEATVRLDCGT